MWRRANQGGRTDGYSRCDTQEMIDQNSPWFRFTGEAGNRLLNSCPPKDSCGTARRIWSSSPMPAVVGQIAHIKVYATSATSTNCAWKTLSVDVVRCSTEPNSFIYKYLDIADGGLCQSAFCGMA